MKPRINIGKLYFFTALVMLCIGLLFGVLSAQVYIYPEFLKTSFGFQALRPFHVSSVMFWILLGATACIYSSLAFLQNRKVSNSLSVIQWCLWMIAIAGILFNYNNSQFGGREYWEYPPEWSFPIIIAWLLFLYNFFSAVLSIDKWPVYIWMWMSGVLFFLFTFIENYLWIFPYFREHFITDMTIQWKVNGSLVGSWNQIIYGTAFFLMDKISKTNHVGYSKMAFIMFFLGLFNLMFNWGHHIYTLPTEPYIRQIGYVVSMTEWIFFIRIIYLWKQSVSEVQKHFHYFPYRFLLAADIWVFLNMGQAILMSIPAINIYTHGTHVTVAHAMGTTIGINTMILLAACFEFLGLRQLTDNQLRVCKISFYVTQFNLLVFWLSLNIAGIKKGIWQLSEQRIPFSKMMHSLEHWFQLFAWSGLILMIAIGTIAILLMVSIVRNKTN